MPGSRWSRPSCWARRPTTTTRSRTSWMSGPTRACRSSASATLRPDFQAPVDLYLEGSDQHRGWFHSSLLMSEALYERAPYRGVLTHGFTVDEKGRKMSKSLGNGIEPQDIMNTLGADVLRLWVAATDYANEMSLSEEILKRMTDSYRRMRNTVRFLLGNLHGFDPQQHAVPTARAGGARSLGDRAHARAAGGDHRGLSRATRST